MHNCRPGDDTILLRTRCDSMRPTGAQRILFLACTLYRPLGAAILSATICDIQIQTTWRRHLACNNMWQTNTDHVVPPSCLQQYATNKCRPLDATILPGTLDRLMLRRYCIWHVQTTWRRHLVCNNMRQTNADHVAPPSWLWCQI